LISHPVPVFERKRPSVTEHLANWSASPEKEGNTLSNSQVRQDMSPSRVSHIVEGVMKE